MIENTSKSLKQVVSLHRSYDAHHSINSDNDVTKKYKRKPKRKKNVNPDQIMCQAYRNVREKINVSNKSQFQ